MKFTNLFCYCREEDNLLMSRECIDPKFFKMLQSEKVFRGRSTAQLTCRFLYLKMNALVPPPDFKVSQFI